MATNGWVLTEVHLYVGPLSDLPMNKKAVQIGHFPYSEENLGGAETWSVSVPLPDGNDCIIAAHAVVYNEELGMEETAWANCVYKPVIAVKVKFPEGKNAESDGISYKDK